MKKLSILVILVASISSHAQKFSLAGNRNIDPAWDIPITRDFYVDSNGAMFIYLTEASQPRSNELVTFNPNTNSWDNLTNNTFLIPGSANSSNGCGQSDGSIYTVTRAFSNNYHYVHQLFPDGSTVDIGNPANTDNLNHHLAIRVDPVSKDLYYVHAGLDRVRAQKWVGTKWLELPDIERTSVSGIHNLDMEFDENGKLYVAYKGNGTNQATVVTLENNGNEWETIFNSDNEGFQPNLLVLSSNEIYLSISVDDINIQVFSYDGDSFIPMGSPVPVVRDFGSSDLLKASTGDLYLATYDENGFYVFDRNTENWTIVENDISDNMAISGFQPKLLEHNGFIFNSFTDNGITVVKYDLNGTLSTEDKALDNDFLIYPNPTSDILTIENLNGFDNVETTLFDLTGKVILLNKDDNNISNNKKIIDTSSLNPGYYLLSIKSNNERIQNFKVIISR